MPAGTSGSGDAGIRPYTCYVLFTLWVIYLFNFIDRQIFAILAEDIKAQSEGW